MTEQYTIMLIPKYDRAAESLQEGALLDFIKVTYPDWGYVGKQFGGMVFTIGDKRLVSQIIEVKQLIFFIEFNYKVYERNEKFGWGFHEIYLGDINLEGVRYTMN